MGVIIKLYRYVVRLSLGEVVLDSTEPANAWLCNGVGLPGSSLFTSQWISFNSGTFGLCPLNTSKIPLQSWLVGDRTPTCW